MGHLVNSKQFRLGIATDWGIKQPHINITEEFSSLNLVKTLVENFFVSRKVVRKFNKLGLLFADFNYLQLPSGELCVIIYFFDSKGSFRLSSLKQLRGPFRIRRESQLGLGKKVMFVQRSLLQAYLSGILRTNVGKIKEFSNVFFVFRPMGDNLVTSAFIVRFLAKKLQQRFALNKILFSVVTLLRSKITNRKLRSPLLGFRFSCAGRFTRKQRATFMWDRFGKIPLNMVSAVIDYTYLPIKLKNGICGLKFWLHFNWNRYNLNYYLFRDLTGSLKFFDQKLFNYSYFLSKNVIEAK